MSILETELRLKVFEIPHGRQVPGLASVRLRMTKRMMYACVEQFRIKAGLTLDQRHIHQRAGEMLVCEHRPVWLSEKEEPVEVPWFATGVEPIFVSKAGTLHLMNMHCKKLVRSEPYALTRLMETFGEDPQPAMIPEGRLLPGQLQGKLALLARY